MLSVVIPVFNSEKYLDKCLKSVIEQGYKDIEIICVNDGSTDHSLAIIEKYKKIDSRIISINKKNEGPVLTRRVGMELAKGEYITCVDSDDWIEANMYCEMVKLAQDNDADVVTSGFVREYFGNSKEAYEGIDKGVYRGKRLYTKYYDRIVGRKEFFEFNVTGSFGNKIFKKELLLKHQKMVPPSIIMGEDPAAVYPTILSAKCVVVTGKNYYHYRIRDNSITSSKNNYIKKNQLVELFNYMDDVLREHYLIIPTLRTQIELWKSYITLSKWPEEIIKEKAGRLFPFKDVKKRDRVILYGNGRFGKFLYTYLKKEGFNVLGVTDSRKDESNFDVDKIKELGIDKVIISVLRADDVREIKKYLLGVNIQENKIQTIDCELLKELYEKKNSLQ